jgi:hypothetical protein
MGKLEYGMMQSHDGYGADPAGGPQLPPPGDQLHRHFNDSVRESAGMICGRCMDEVMRYWDDAQPGWDAGACDCIPCGCEGLPQILSRRLDNWLTSLRLARR